MEHSSLMLEDLFNAYDFSPNKGQREAIQTLDGPLFLMAGPGSGKTRVLLWRTVNAIVFHNVSPERIFLSTFTEKASKQLKDGLQGILGTVTNMTGTSYDISRMYIGTVHSLCQRILSDRRFTVNRERLRPPILIDELDQYFYINSTNFWRNAEEMFVKTEEDLRNELKDYFGVRSQARHEVSLSLISLFNRFSEENFDLEKLYHQAQQEEGDTLLKIVRLYEWYKEKLRVDNAVDFASLQQRALQQLLQSEKSKEEFEYIIIDEFQDTNRIQEKIFFNLAKGTTNFCVVGDDDQALYRFRGATVENFVQFPERCELYLHRAPTKIKLNINYRSKKQIVSTYTNFIDNISWVRESGSGYYRLNEKNIQPFSQDNEITVMTSTPNKSEVVANEIAVFVKQLIDSGKVTDPNQIAFLFPALKNGVHVQRMKKALEDQGLKVYAPRAGRFLETEEARAIFGLFIKVFGKPERQQFGGAYGDYHNWLADIEELGDELTTIDDRMTSFLDSKKEELQQCKQDYLRLYRTIVDNGWNITDAYKPTEHKRSLSKTPFISEQTIRGLGTDRLDKLIEQRARENKPFNLQYILNRATSVDWNVLDLFYRLCGFGYFSQMFKLAEDGTDEGPVCNLAMITEYLARYMEQSGSVITGSKLIEDKFRNNFFGRYLYGLFRIGESEVENEETPFPKGRIPFLTIHQSKGLEFPYVVLGSPGKRNRGVQRNEEIVRPMIDGDNEPLDRIPEFDTMRLFYVALSRAEKGLIITNLKGQGQYVAPEFKKLFSDMNYPVIPNVDISHLETVTLKEELIPKVYSYTSDYLLYLKCPRNYMIFKKYNFVPSRSQTMLFGNLVHRTIEDIHNQVIFERGEVNG